MSTATLQIAREEINEATVKLSVVCTPEQVRAGYQKAFKQLAKEIRLPGFRPGSAPAALIEKQVSPEELNNFAAEEIVRLVLPKVYKETGIEPSSQPSADITKIDRAENAFEFTLKVPLKAVVELGEVKGLTVEVPPVDVTDEEVDNYIGELRKREGKQEKIADRGISPGDMAVVNIKLEGDEGEGRTFMTIAGQTFPGLDEQLVGMQAEEIKHAELAFPASFQEKDWAGQTHKCSIAIRSVSAVVMPELDDDFAKKLKADSVDDLKTKVRNAILTAKGRSVEEMIHEQLMDGLLKRSRIVVPTTTWESVAQRRLREIVQDLRERKTSLEDYVKSQNMTIDEFVEALEKEAKVHVERAVMIENIFRQEGMTVSDEIANAHLMDVLIQNQVPMDEAPKFLKDFGGQVREEVIFRSMQGLVLGFMREHATITTVDFGSGEPSA